MRCLACRAKVYVMVGDTLYKKCTIGILQKCMRHEQWQQMLRDIHGGICGHHAAPRSLVGKAL